MLKAFENSKYSVIILVLALFRQNASLKNDKGFMKQLQFVAGRLLHNKEVLI